MQATRYHATRPPILRMVATDQGLRANKSSADKTLAGNVEVDPRTIRRDLSSMRHQLHAPLGFDRARREYQYTDLTFRLSFRQLSQGELGALFFAERVIHQFRATPFEPDLRQAIDNLSGPFHKWRRGYDALLVEGRESFI